MWDCSWISSNKSITHNGITTYFNRNHYFDNFETKYDDNIFLNGSDCIKLEDMD